MHEAQSRFFENYVGRSLAFAPRLAEVMARQFRGQLGRVTPGQLYAAANRVEAQPIRTEADELTYPLHVLVRYEIERLLMAGEANASDVPRLWTERYKDYLGIDVPNDARGALQDTHWSGGMIGYFPTYALGSAIGAQLKATMEREGMNFDDVCASGDLTPIHAWLRDRIWRYGRSRDTNELMIDACGEPFSATYFTDYLTEKFSALYGL
jgi:carboxypeptidase Taq